MGRSPKPTKGKAKPAVSRKSPKTEASKVRDLEKRLAEALAREEATAEILRVISSSPADAQPVFDAIAESAKRLCDGDLVAVFRFDGTMVHPVTVSDLSPEAAEAFARAFPQKPDPHSLVGRAILDRAVVHTSDVEHDPRLSAEARSRARLRGRRSGVQVPMLRGDQPIGAIGVSRLEPRPFSEAQIGLLRTFADQAVIAIENVRLFKELEARNRDLTEALEQQTATAEILRVISQSPTDVQPVLEAVAESAARLCGATDAIIHRVDGDVLRRVAHFGSVLVSASGVRPITSETPAGRAILDRRTIHLHDILDSFSRGEYLESLDRQRNAGYRTLLVTPLLREDSVIGVITVRRLDVRPFTEKQVELVQTFADQAVIAIENVRLFSELQTSNHELTTALDTQTATADILRVISRSQTDVQPVFDAIVESAVRLLRGFVAAISRLAGDQLELAAFTSTDPAGDAAVRSVFPQALASDWPHSRVVRERGMLNVTDARSDPQLPEAIRSVAVVRGYQSLVVLPMLRHDEAIGAISVTRREPGGFTDDELSLLQTFADQAVIAIENVRLFTELQEKNQALTKAHAQVSESLEQQTATAQILRVISQSPTDVQPVFDAIVDSAVRLCDGAWADAYRFDGERQHFVACSNLPPEGRALLRRLYPRAPDPEAVTGRAILDRTVIHVSDAHHDPRFAITRHVSSTVGGASRSVLAVPMLHREEALGVILVHRGEQPRPFSSAEIDLLKTFADQAVIAIENVRLFTELQARTQELTRSVGQLTALGDVARAVSSTLDLDTVLSTIVSRAIQLSGTDGGSVYEYDEATEEFSLRASRHLPEAYVEQVRDTRPRKGEGAVGRVAQTREPVQIADISDPAAYDSRVRNTLLQMGLRALLAVPLIAEDRLVGALIVMRERTGTFAAEEVALLQTFATQSALAIQNARLFREIADKSRQLEVASQHKSEFLANMSHELRTPLNAIIGFSEVLSERMFGELNEKQEEYLKDIYASGNHLLSLINDILDLSKIEAGRMELELSDFHLPTALDSALTLVRERAGRRSIALHLSVDERLDQIQGDERKVRQVVLNLLSNAIKFTPEGGRVEVGAAPRDGFVEVSVTDSGVGIAPEDQEAVFEEFRQVGTADKKVEGTGLGLTLCRKFVELHGGKIWVKSQLGAGSTFTFTIPVRHGE